MNMAMYLVTAVLVEGRPVREVARDHGVSKTWVYELLARFEAEGEAGLVLRSRWPHHSPTKIVDPRAPQAPDRLELRHRARRFDRGAREGNLGLALWV
jgi:transposase